MEAKFSGKLLKRLPIYLNYIKALETENISATRMARDLGLGDVMVRKDLAKVSDGGRRKLGYVREALIRDIEEFLDVNSTACAVVIGAGKLGQALLDYQGFAKSGLDIVAGFDLRPERSRTSGGKPIYQLNRLGDFCQCHAVSVAILTVPADSAQEVCDLAVGLGITAIWNFAPTHLTVPEKVVVQTENLAASLTSLRMKMKSRDEELPPGYEDE